MRQVNQYLSAAAVSVVAVHHHAHVLIAVLVLLILVLHLEAMLLSPPVQIAGVIHTILSM